MSGKSKFLSFLYTLTPEELAAFDLHLRRHYPKEVSCLRAFEYASRFHPSVTHRKLVFERAYQKVFGEVLPEDPLLRASKTKNLQNLFSKLFLWLKDFLLYQKIQEQPTDLQRDLLWATILEEHGMTRGIAQFRKHLKEKADQLPHDDIPAAFQKMTVSYQLNYNLRPGVSQTDLEELKNFTIHLDGFYAVTRLKLACEIATLKDENTPATAFAMESALPVEHFIPSFSDLFLKKNPLLAIYMELFQMIVNKRAETYEATEALFRKNFHSIAPEEQSAIMVYLQNYAAARILEGETIFLKRVHELNVFGIKNNFFIRSGLLSATHFNNIITTACKAEAFDWAENFVRKYSRYLSDDIRESTSIIGKAIISFEREDYARAVSTLKKIQSPDLPNEIRCRCLVLRSHWELQTDDAEFDALVYAIAFEQYLNRHKKDGPKNIPGVLNFLKIFKYLIFKRKEKAWLLEEIKRTNPLFFRDWLNKHGQKYQAASHKRRL